MADNDSTKEVEEDVEEVEEVETPKGEDESKAKVDQSDKPEEETEVEDEESEESEETPPTFDKRFTQFKGETPAEYAKNLEAGYANSTAEAIKLNKQLVDYKQRVDQITAAVATDPELAEKLNVTQVSPDPALNYARQEMEAKQEQEYNTFAKDHPEIESDPVLGERLTKRLAAISKAVYADEGRMLGMGEGMEMAWSSLGLGNNQQERTSMAAKEAAATTKTASAKKSAPKSEFTPAQIKVAEKMGLTEKDLRASINN